MTRTLPSAPRGPNGTRASHARHTPPSAPPSALRTVSVLTGVALAMAVGAVGLNVHAANLQAGREAAWELASSRTNAVAAATRADEAFSRTRAAAAAAATIAAFRAERAAALTNRDAAAAAGAAALTASPDADPAMRTQLGDALAKLATSGGVLADVTSATAAATTATASVTASEAAWQAADAARQAATTAAASQAAPKAAGRKTTAPTTTPPTSTPGDSLRDIGESALRALPGSAGVSISWNDPDLSGHLGAVWLGNTTTIMVNATKLAGQPAKVRDVVRHEIGHIYQGRLAAAAGIPMQELLNRMGEVFGANSRELSADCVAQRFGATWLHYSSACSDPAKQAWVDGLIGGYLP